MTWRTDFPPVDRQFLLAWKETPDELFPQFAIAKLNQVDDYGDEEHPLPVYLPRLLGDVDDIRFDEQTLFAWAEIEPPALGAWEDHMVEGFF